MADTFKKASAKASKKAPKKVVVKDTATKKVEAPKPAKELSPKPTLPELRAAWGEAQAVTTDRERGLRRAIATQNSKQDRQNQITEARSRLSKARAVESQARDRFTQAQRKAQRR